MSREVERENAKGKIARERGFQNSINQNLHSRGSGSEAIEFIQNVVLRSAMADSFPLGFGEGIFGGKVIRCARA